jgi:hypothetical protein
MKRYVIYAIGEILLVMLGILLALQVNNWNEGRKNREIEIEILSVIYANLINDLDDFEKNLIHFSNKKESCNAILEFAENNVSYHDSMSFYFLYASIFPHFTPNTSGYELLKSKGLDLVSNDSLKIAITNLYEYGYKYLQTWESEQMGFNSTILSPILLNYTGIKTVTTEDIPKTLDDSRNHLSKFSSAQMVLNIKNFEKLKLDTKLLTVLTHLKGVSNLIGRFHEQTQQDVMKVIKQLELELRLPQ